MAFGLFETIFFVFILFPFLLMVIALVDLLRRPVEAWEAAREDRLIWLLVVIFVGLVGPVLYLTIARSKLEAAAQVNGGVTLA